MILTSRRHLDRVLTGMHSALRKSDPTLVGKFLIFSRLTRDEAIPTVERVKQTALGLLASAVRDATRRRRLTRPRRRGTGRWRLREILFIPAAIAALVAVALLTNGGQSAARCTPAYAAAHSSSIRAPAGHSTAWQPEPKSACLFP
jgi:hypothetical protein